MTNQRAVSFSSKATVWAAQNTWGTLTTTGRPLTIPALHGRKEYLDVTNDDLCAAWTQSLLVPLFLEANTDMVLSFQAVILRLPQTAPLRFRSTGDHQISCPNFMPQGVQQWFPLHTALMYDEGTRCNANTTKLLLDTTSPRSGRSIHVLHSGPRFCCVRPPPPPLCPLPDQWCLQRYLAVHILKLRDNCRLRIVIDNVATAGTLRKRRSGWWIFWLGGQDLMPGRARGYLQARPSLSASYLGDPEFKSGCGDR